MTQEIIKLFLKNDMLVSRKALEHLARLGKVDDLVKRVPKSLVVGVEHLTAQEPPQKPAGNPTIEKAEVKFEHDYKILQSFKTSSKLDVSDAISMNAARFEKLRKILSEKYELENLTTMNKLGNFGEASVIGEVKKIEHDGKVAEVEDTTGSVKTLFEETPSLFVGDIVGIHGSMRKEYFISKKLIFPDVPLRREVKVGKRDVVAIFAAATDKTKARLSELLAEKKAKYVFNCGSSNIDVAKECIPLGDRQNDAESFEVEGLRVMRIRLPENFSRLGENSALEAVKRRGVKYGIENFVVEEIPDFIYAYGKGCVKNYKGTTILQCDPGKAFVVNLSTRDLEEINLEKAI